MSATTELRDPGSAAPLGGTSGALGPGKASVFVELAPDGTLVSDDDGRMLLAGKDERIAAQCDVIIRHLFASGLTLASVLGRNDLDAITADRIHEVIDELDRVIRELRHVVFEQFSPG